jgi:cytochrome c oxidase subunit 2
MTNWFMNYMPLQASQHAAEIDHMTVLVHWLMLIMFIGWGAFFLFVLVRFRKGANPTASYAGAKGKFAKGTEIVVAIIEIVLLVGYAIPAWATRVKALPAENEAVIVRVVGEQFAWNVHYPGRTEGSDGPTSSLVAADNPLGLDKNDADAKDDLTAINQMNVPVDRPVLVHLSSKDVIHSFGLYEMRIKQDAVPVSTSRCGSSRRSPPTRCAARWESRTSSTKSPARSSAAWDITGCEGSSPCNQRQTSRSGSTISSGAASRLQRAANRPPRGVESVRLRARTARR